MKDDKKGIKCIVWDLDETLWHGVLLENDELTLRNNVVEIVKTLDSRGILQSIASKNDRESAMTRLSDFGLQEYFLHPQINWNSKATSIAAVARLLNIGLDSVAFIDDQEFERGEVAFSLPEVLCIDAAALDQLLDMPAMNPRFITDDSRNRRQMYLQDAHRSHEEEDFSGSTEEFLATLNMTLTISSAQEEDLRRAEELTLRTNQLNTTGYTLSYDELNQVRQSDRYKLLIASLDDKYGSYGKIGLALIECVANTWNVKLLLMSCRVMSRGVGMVMINHILQLAKEQQVRLYADFVSNDRNRLMYVTYKFAGFKEVEKRSDAIVFENDLTRIQPFPLYMQVTILN
jgi:FkbH-like protein